MQEMRLIEAAYDGDVGGVCDILGTGVSVDVTKPVVRPRDSLWYS